MISHIWQLSEYNGYISEDSTLVATQIVQHLSTMKIPSIVLCVAISLLSVVVLSADAFPLDQPQVSTKTYIIAKQNLYTKVKDTAKVYIILSHVIQLNEVADEKDALESLLPETAHIRSARQVQFDAGCIAACARRVYMLRMAHLRSRFFASFYRRRFVPHYLACRNGCIISKY